MHGTNGRSAFYCICTDPTGLTPLSFPTPHTQVLEKCVAQLDTIFSQLEQRHMSGDHPEQAAKPSTLPKAREVFLGGMYWDWRPSHHPYIGGGYCSPLANKPITSGKHTCLSHQCFCGDTEYAYRIMRFVGPHK